MNGRTNIDKNSKKGFGNKPGYWQKRRQNSKKKAAARQSLVDEYRIKAEELLKDYNCEVDERVWERIQQEAISKASSSFSNDRFSLYGMRVKKGDIFKSRYYKDAVTADNYEDFVDNVYAESDELIDLALDGDGILARYIAFRLMKYDRDLREMSDGFKGIYRETFAEVLCGKLSMSDIPKSLSARLGHYFSKKRIEKLLSRNQNFELIAKEAIKKDAQNRVIEKHILESIPDNYIELYPEAREIERHFVLHVGPTNSGKTHDALEELRMAPSGIYLAPLRLLACEVKDRLNEAGTPCDLRTGEEKETYEDARHMASTIEMLDTSRYYDVAVIDEGQMINDTQRGGSWTAAILGVCASIVHVCMAEFAKDIVIDLIEECSDTYEIINHRRQTKLKFDSEDFEFPDSVADGDALIVFSKRDVLSCAAVLQKSGINCSVVYGALPYDARKSEVGRFLSGETKVIVATDAIGMGMNLPIRRVVFLRTSKYDGVETRVLFPEEVQQIAGRAGRYGLYNMGFYTSEFDKGLIHSLYNEKVLSIKRAPIGFPKSLINIEGKLSDIMLRWSKIQDNDDLYYKGDISEMMTLAKWMEQFTDNKELTYSFATIPFDIKSETLMAIWERMVIDKIDGYETEYRRPIYDLNDLQSMESAFRVCDLYYCYADRFNTADKDDISYDRRMIANDIAEYLRTHELPVRKCRRCGRELAWNYPHQYCYKCSRMR